jgi:hypothetical protein
MTQLVEEVLNICWSSQARRTVAGEIQNDPVRPTGRDEKECLLDVMTWLHEQFRGIRKGEREYEWAQVYRR